MARRGEGRPRQASQDVHDQQVHVENRQVPGVVVRHLKPPKDVGDNGLIREVVCEHGGPVEVHEIN